MQHLLFKQKLAKMLCTQLKTQVKAQNLTDYQALLVSCEEWSEKHYQLASEIIGVSHSTLRRIYLPLNYAHEGFNKRTKAAIISYLGFDCWDKLLAEIFRQLAIEQDSMPRGF